jgi:hypothetical protein
MRAYFYAFVVLCFVLITHIIGIRGMYVIFPPYDIFMHILGGIGIGLAVCAAIKLHGEKIIYKRRAIIIGVLIVGIIWELFEIYYDIAGSPLGTIPYYIDTVKDLMDDVIGGTLAAWLFMKR